MSEKRVNAEKTIEAIRKTDKRYDPQAYRFVFEALEFTQDRLGRDPKSSSSEERHVSGGELLDGIRDYARERFGLLAKTVFNEWGVTQTLDFGEIVFNLVEAGLMGKTETDQKEDFSNRYDFTEAFEKTFNISLEEDLRQD